MKTHTTNYFDVLVEIAPDCKVSEGTPPPLKSKGKSVANYQYDMLHSSPYIYCSDDVLFLVFALRKKVPSADMDAARTTFFSKGQPCFRASPLTKNYGWGVHHNASGQIALLGCETKEYQDLLANNAVKKVKAMRSKRA